jgi:hypothetical protein
MLQLEHILPRQFISDGTWIGVGAIKDINESGVYAGISTGKKDVEKIFSATESD